MGLLRTVTKMTTFYGSDARSTHTTSEFKHKQPMFLRHTLVKQVNCDPTATRNIWNI